MYIHTYHLAIYTYIQILYYIPIDIHHPKKVLGLLWLPLLRLLLWWFFSEALSISTPVLINDVSFVERSKVPYYDFQ